MSDDVRGHFDERVFRTVIPRSVRLSEAPSFGEPVITLDPSSRGAIAFKMLAAEVEERFELAPHKTTARLEKAIPGPGGRGFGTTTPQPAGLASAWPPAHPFEGGGR